MCLLTVHAAILCLLSLFSCVYNECLVFVSTLGQSSWFWFEEILALVHWFNHYLFSGCLLIIEILLHFHKSAICNTESISELPLTCWGSLSRVRAVRPKVIQRREEKRRGPALRKKCNKSTASPQPLHHPSVVECSSNGVVERREASHHLSGSESCRARTLLTLMLSKRRVQQRIGLDMQIYVHTVCAVWVATGSSAVREWMCCLTHGESIGWAL